MVLIRVHRYAMQAGLQLCYLYATKSDFLLTRPIIIIITIIITTSIITIIIIIIIIRHPDKSVIYSQFLFFNQNICFG